MLVTKHELYLQGRIDTLNWAMQERERAASFRRWQKQNIVGLLCKAFNNPKWSWLYKRIYKYYIHQLYNPDPHQDTMHGRLVIQRNGLIDELDRYRQLPNEKKFP